MVKTRRSLVACLALAAIALPAGAEVFTVKLNNATEFVTRYQPRQDARDENKVMLLTEFGNWVALSKDAIAEITSETESRGFGTVLDTRTIVIGWAPNDRPDPNAAPPDPTTQLLNYLKGRDSMPEQDFTVQQFVNTEGAGVGGIPAAGITSSGSSSFPVGAGGTAAFEPSVIDQ